MDLLLGALYFIIYPYALKKIYILLEALNSLKETVTAIIIIGTTTSPPNHYKCLGIDKYVAININLP
jgi:hypothetical protein